VALIDNGAGVAGLVQAQAELDSLLIRRADFAAFANTGGAFSTFLTGQLSFRVVKAA
jgi:hypothetical protein